ncbi:MAG: tyrosine-protein phosphatase [Fusobacteriaceae bacterium]
MVDLHSHILYLIDDGAQSLDESLQLCREAVKLGYKEIVCTSHYQKGYYENKSYFKNFENLKSYLIKESINLKLYSGNEIYLDIDTFLYLSKKEFNTLNNSKYVLVEFPKGLIFSAKINMLKKLIEWGYYPIIAHIERYSDLLDNFEELKKLSVKTQFNLSSIDYFLENYKKLFLNGDIDIVSTDAHRISGRNYDLKEKLELLKKVLGPAKFKEITETNPKAIIQN